jgi:hypothetical protein
MVKSEIKVNGKSKVKGSGRGRPLYTRVRRIQASI